MKMLFLCFSIFALFSQNINAKITVGEGADEVVISAGTAVTPQSATTNQLWADQQCGGSPAYKDDKDKFNACVAQKMKSKEPAAKKKSATEDLEAYILGCKDALAKAKPGMDKKDVDMFCRDPYLNGTPNESAEDKSRRERLIKESNQAKMEMMDNVIKKQKEPSPYDMSTSMSTDEYRSYLKNCKTAILQNNPNKDAQDINMLCQNPYLYEPPNENDADKSRRKRLLGESDSLKAKALDKYVTPTPAKKKSSAGTGR